MTEREKSALSTRSDVFKLFNIARPEKLTYEFCDQFFAITDYGLVVDFFVAVPCRTCSACRCLMVNSIRQRILFAIQETRTKPLFVTLTYNDAHLPCGRQVFRVDVQKFLKRLRRYLERHYDARIKVYYVSEYTPVTNRPHYHLLIFGFPYLAKDAVLNQFMRYHLIQYCWREPDVRMSFRQYRIKFPMVFKRPKDYDPCSFGYVDLVEVCSLGVVNYLCKYFHKNVDDLREYETHDPLASHPDKLIKHKSKYFRKDFTRRNFRGCSINLGVDFVRSHVKKSSNEITFTDWLTRRVQSLRICGYYMQKLYPSLSRLVPIQVRNAYRYSLQAISDILNSNVKFPNSIIRQLLHTRMYLQDNFPYVDTYYKSEFANDYKTSELLVWEYYSSLCKWSSIVYAWLTNTDLNVIDAAIANRDRILAGIPPDSPLKDYSKFDLQMQECLNKQKLL